VQVVAAAPCLIFIELHPQVFFVSADVRLFPSRGPPLASLA
jgi:hypothetical protein